ncbi:MAG: hypothetical protein BWY71_01533 [Planctomycetes bacterium ADurb.Bin412]|nr:MAG: hypothetical protein BWY71_01533 [Planctomycetes bacterium ADurb.Bin412]
MTGRAMRLRAPAMAIGFQEIFLISTPPKLQSRAVANRRKIAWNRCIFSVVIGGDYNNIYFAGKTELFPIQRLAAPKRNAGDNTLAEAVFRLARQAKGGYFKVIVSEFLHYGAEYMPVRN